MQITELLRLTDWFKLNIVEAKIPALYTNLFNKMNQNARAINNQPKQPFETEKQLLFEALKSVKLNSLTLEQINF